MDSFFRTNSTSSSSSSNTKLKEEIHIQDINQDIDNWEIPKYTQTDIYERDRKWMFSASDYTIKTVEQTIALDADHEEIKLLSKRTIEKHKEKYNYIHFGLVQIAAKPLTREGLDISILLCLRNSRLLEFNDSLLEMAETSFCGGPVYFDCFPNFTVS